MSDAQLSGSSSDLLGGGLAWRLGWEVSILFDILNHEFFCQTLRMST